MDVDLNVMIKGIKKLKKTKRPKMDAGVRYLYTLIYEPMVHGRDIPISSIDFDRFSISDVNAMIELYETDLEKGNDAAQKVAGILCESKPLTSGDKKFF